MYTELQVPNIVKPSRVVHTERILIHSSSNLYRLRYMLSIAVDMYIMYLCSIEFVANLHLFISLLLEPELELKTRSKLTETDTES